MSLVMHTVAFTPSTTYTTTTVTYQPWNDSNCPEEGVGSSREEVDIKCVVTASQTQKYDGVAV